MKKSELSHESSRDDNENGKSGSIIRVSNGTTCLSSESCPEDSPILQPARMVQAQISVDDSRRCLLVNILSDKVASETLINEWMSSIEEENDTNLLNPEKIFILLRGISDYLEKSDLEPLERALDRICGRKNMDEDSRVDLERAFYLLIQAIDKIPSFSRKEPAHVVFALQNIVRRVIECAVGLIRSDFTPAVNSSSSPSAALHSSQSSLSSLGGSPFTGVDESANDELVRLNDEHKQLAEKNREQLRRLVELEQHNDRELAALISQHRASSESQLFLRIDSSPSVEHMNLSIPSPASSVEPISGTPQRGIKRSRALLELEHEHDQLLSHITDNRMRFNQNLLPCRETNFFF